MAETRTKTVTIRLNEELHRRLKAKLAAEGTNFQQKVETLLHEYLEGPASQRNELRRRVELLRQTIHEYEPALRELAR
jgi:DNA anti-recombination protein RmuC